MYNIQVADVSSVEWGKSLTKKERAVQRKRTHILLRAKYKKSAVVSVWKEMKNNP